MTALTSTTVAPPRTSEAARHILSVVRLHFVNKVQVLYTPLAALGAIFVLNLAIWWIIIIATGGDNPHNHVTNHLGYSGAVSYIYVYAIVIAVQSIQRTFPFSLGFGVTRRDFYLGTALAFIVLSTIFAIILTVMSSIEIATNGWGIGGRMFAPVYFTNTFWLARFVMYFLVFLFCLFIGSVVATIYVRWRAFGVAAFFAILGVVLVAAIAEITLNDQWPAIGNWIATTGTFGIVVWTLLPTALAGIAGFLVLRRATPKS